MIKRVHLIYPHGPQINCPEAIGRNLGKYLARHYKVHGYHWATVGRLKPDPEAALVGHPHPSPLTLFRRSAAQEGWGKVVMLAPFNAEPRQMAWYEPALSHCDVFAAITGPYWWRAMEQGPFVRWKPRMRRLDLAVDPKDFPRVKRSFAPQGKRRFLYIGHSGWPKNTDYLSEIALSFPDWGFSWLGPGKAIPGVKHLGKVDFSKPEARLLVAGYDFMITVGSNDANPATILEAMAWGLLPVCSPQSGYEKEAGIVNVPLNDLAGARKVLQRLQSEPEARLRARMKLNDVALKRRFSWDRFGREVRKALAPGRRLPLASPKGSEAWMLAWQRATCPMRPLRWRWLAQALYQKLSPSWLKERTYELG